MAGNFFYGTPRLMSMKPLIRGIDVFAELKYKGALRSRKSSDTVFIFLGTTRFGRIADRLVGRGTNDAEVIFGSVSKKPKRREKLL